MLQLARGELLVLIGTPPQWLPESGARTTLTLLSGAPRARPAARAALEMAFIALQGAGSRCARTAARARGAPLEIAGYYAHRNLISAQPGSAFAGAQAGDYATSVNGVVVKQVRETRACVWLGTAPQNARLVHVQTIPLLNGLFAASVSTLPDTSAGSAAGTGYTLNAVEVGGGFSYTVATTQCGTGVGDSSGLVRDGQLATESIAIDAHPCAGDGSQFSFVGTGGSLGTLGYTVAQAAAAPPAIATLGGCELDPVAGAPLAAAEQYVVAVGCRVGRLLVARYQPGLPSGVVTEAQVDGGLAEVAPAGTAVDLVINTQR